MKTDSGELARLAAALGGLPVLACRPGSPAEQAGVRYGDIVLSVNGVKTPDWASFVEARAKDTERMRFELVRDGVRLEIEIDLPGATPVDPQSLLADILADRSKRCVPVEALMRDPEKRPPDKN